MAIPRYSCRTDLVASTVLKLYSSGMTDEEMRLAISSIYEASRSQSTISAITDAVAGGVRRFSSRPLPGRLFALFLDSTYVPLRRGAVEKEAVNIAMGVTDEGIPLVVGYPINPSESAEGYAELLEGFRAPAGPSRGPSPGPGGSAASSTSSGTSVRRCVPGTAPMSPTTSWPSPGRTAGGGPGRPR